MEDIWIWRFMAGVDYVRCGKLMLCNNELLFQKKPFVNNPLIFSAGSS
jgi:hypothetical protein